jgi:uroporphyrinogen-III synthase
MKQDPIQLRLVTYKRGDRAGLVTLTSSSSKQTLFAAIVHERKSRISYGEQVLVLTILYVGESTDAALKGTNFIKGKNGVAYTR